MLQLLWHFGEFVLRQDLFRQPLRAATFPKGEGMALPRQHVKLQFTMQPLSSVTIFVRGYAAHALDGGLPAQWGVNGNIVSASGTLCKSACREGKNYCGNLS